MELNQKINHNHVKKYIYIHECISYKILRWEEVSSGEKRENNCAGEKMKRRRGIDRNDNDDNVQYTVCT